jgi:hypothetical protein
MNKKNIECIKVDAGDRNAGSIRVIYRAKEPQDPKKPKEVILYQMQVNKNHLPSVQFASIAHELGHLFLGHLGPDKALNVPFRYMMNPAQWETGSRVRVIPGMCPQRRDIEIRDVPQELCHTGNNG